MKKYRDYFFVILFALLIYAIIWISFSLWVKFHHIDSWKLIPNNAISVIETASLKTAFEMKKEFLSSDNHRNSGKEKAALVSDYIFEALEKTVSEKAKIKATFSIHSTSRFDFGVLAYFQKKEAVIFYNYLQELDSADFMLKRKRKYAGFEITELKLIDFNRQKAFPKMVSENDKFHFFGEKNSETFSYFTYKDKLICSSNPLLLESVIRTINNADEESKLVSFKRKILFSEFAQKDISVFVRKKALSDFLHLFIQKENPQSPLTALQYFLEQQPSFISNLKADSSTFFLKGKHLKSNVKNSYLSIFEKKYHNDSSYKKLLPQTMAFYFRLQFLQGISLENDLQNFWETYEPKQFLAYQKSASWWENSEKELYAHFKNELIFVQLAEEKSHFCYVQISEEEAMKELILNLAENSAANKQVAGSIVENYGNYEIINMLRSDLPTLLFGKLFANFPQTYLCIIDNYLVFSPTSNTLKEIINTNENKESQYVFSDEKSSFKRGNNNANLYLDVFNSWNLFHNNFNIEHQNSFAQKRKQFLHYNSLQFSTNNKENKIHFSLHKKEKPFSENGKMVSVYKTDLAYFTARFPQLVTNHNTQKAEVLLQDRKSHLSLISENGKLLWKYPIGKKITSNIYQIDRYKNGLLYYIFAVDNKIYLLNRLGKMASGYPIILPPYIQTQHFSVFKNQKTHKLLFSDKGGNVFMSTIFGNVLSNWSPLKLGFGLCFPPTSIKISEKNYIVTLQKNGTLNAFNIQGNQLQNFPLLFDVEVNSSLFIKQKENLENTSVTFVTKIGELISVNLKGKIISRQQTPNAFERSIYQLCIDQNKQKDYLLSVQNDNNISIFNSEMKLLFKKEFTNSSAKKVHYFNFGSTVQLLAITDTKTEKTYLYRKNGVAIIENPLQSSQQINVKYNFAKRTYSVYFNYRNSSQCVQIIEN